MGAQGKLLSIDISPKNDQILGEVLERFGLNDRVELLIGDSRNVMRDDLYDFVFIDGDHSYEGAKQDHNKWGQLVKTGGYIIHHDMANSRPFSTQEADLSRLRSDIIGKQKDEVEIVHEVGSLCSFRRKTLSWTII